MLSLEVLSVRLAPQETDVLLRLIDESGVGVLRPEGSCDSSQAGIGEASSSCYAVTVAENGAPVPRTAYRILETRGTDSFLLLTWRLPAGLFGAAVQLRTWIDLVRNRLVVLLLLITTLYMSGQFVIFTFMGPQLSIKTKPTGAYDDRSCHVYQEGRMFSVMSGKIGARVDTAWATALIAPYRAPTDDDWRAAACGSRWRPGGFWWPTRPGIREGSARASWGQSPTHSPSPWSSQWRKPTLPPGPKPRFSSKGRYSGTSGR